MPSRRYLLRLFIKMFTLLMCMGFPGGSDGKESACSSGDPDSTPGSGRSPGEGKYGSEKNKVLCVKVKKSKRNHIPIPEEFTIIWSSRGEEESSITWIR